MHGPQESVSTFDYLFTGRLKVDWVCRWWCVSNWGNMSTTCITLIKKPILPMFL